MLRWWDFVKDRVQGKAPKGAKRSSKWRKVRAEFLRRSSGRCAVCGLKTKLEVHHMVPFHIAPDLELNMDNLIALCENKKWGINCHLLIGHLGNYSEVNPNVKADSMYWRFKLAKYED
jgi:hypothetical protein